MATTANAVWEVRPTTGVDTNGAMYDSSIAGAGTDYSQQDAAQLTLTDIVNAVGTSVVTSVVGGFTSAMVGNGLRISSVTTGFLVGYYTIVGFTSANSITIDRTCSGGAGGTGGTCSIGGAAKTLTLQTTSGLANSANGGAVGGNKIWVKNQAWNAAETGFGSYLIGAPLIIEGYNTARGDAPKPSASGNMPRNNTAGASTPFTLGAQGGMIWRYIWASNSSGVGFSMTTGGNIFEFCKASANATIGFQVTTGRMILRGCESTGNTTRGVRSTSSGTIILEGCNIHGNTTLGVDQSTGASTLVHNLIYANASHGFATVSTTISTALINNTINANTGASTDGINISSAVTGQNMILNNQITNNGRDGVRADVATQHVVSNYNNFFGNAGAARTNWVVGDADLAVDPQYVNAGTGDYRIGTPTKALAYPTALEGAAAACVSYLDIGAVQRLETGGRFQGLQSIETGIHP